MNIIHWVDDMAREVEAAGARLSESMFDPVIRLGVTGLARAGKTVFITSLVANLLDRGRMTGLGAERDGRIEAAFLRPQPDDTVPRFPFETNIAALTGDAPHWPEPTASISELRLSFRLRPRGLLGAVQGARRLHLDIVDYPGEWLLDLALLDQSYDDWSAQVLDRLATRDEAQAYLAAIADIDPSAPHDDAQAAALAEIFAAYLHAAKDAGYTDCTPGRMLLPGDLAGSPVVSLAPLPPGHSRARGTLGAEMARRFVAYKRKVIRPFFRDHFARIDRQVVLVDALGALAKGPAALADVETAMAGVLGAFRPGRSARLSRLLGRRRVDRILFAATKADHLHHSQHDKLATLMQVLTRQARDRAAFSGARTEALALAALRSTTETTRMQDGVELGFIQGRRIGCDRPVAYHPGELPTDPARLLKSGTDWPEIAPLAFAPAPLSLAPGDGPPHIRLDRAAEFLLGDRL